LPNGFIRSWLRGSSVETLLTETFERLVSDPTIITPLLDVLNKELKVDINKAGVRFVLDDVLTRASQSTRFAFSSEDQQRPNRLFMMTKVISIFVGGRWKEEELPDFFPEETRVLIQRLRQNNELVEEFEMINRHLQKAIEVEITGHEDFNMEFFAFKSQLLEDSDQMQALTLLQEAGTSLSQSTFSRILFRILADEFGGAFPYFHLDRFEKQDKKIQFLKDFNIL
ncbi:MAG: hypothetical protein K1060chlam2_01151, partial [Chlamydiae bacterium]|nr:hypothetical protein [Chlamydiota bacterium]